MPTRNEKVLNRIIQRIQKNPEITNAELRKVAVKMDPSIDDLTPRQFHARYALAAKRRIASEAKGGRVTAQKKSTQKKVEVQQKRESMEVAVEVDRGQVREVLLALAQQVASAETKGDIVDIVSGIDKYVDQLENLVRK